MSETTLVHHSIATRRDATTSGESHFTPIDQNSLSNTHIPRAQNWGDFCAKSGFQRAGTQLRRACRLHSLTRPHRRHNAAPCRSVSTKPPRTRWYEISN
jgi:hypothetical protein